MRAVLLLAIAVLALPSVARADEPAPSIEREIPVVALHPLSEAAAHMDAHGGRRELVFQIRGDFRAETLESIRNR